MIKIQNVYYMLAYAFRVLNEKSYTKIASEEFDYVSDLFAAILTKGIGNQIKRGLGREYISKMESFSVPRGKIDVSASIKRQTFLKKQLVCDVDEFAENTYLNQVLKTTTMLLIRSADVAPLQKQALKKIMPFFAEVDEVDPRKIKWSAIKYHRNNGTYKMLMNICYLVIEGMLLTETDGVRKLARYVDDQRMHRLYERFVLEYYRRHFPEFHPAAAHIDWDVDDDVTLFLPAMKSDITLSYRGKALIIDTKYYGSTMQTNCHYDNRTIHSNNLYQIFTYVKNSDINHSGNVSGVLLYAKTDEELTPNSDYMMSGNRISVKTLDLGSDFSNIKMQLAELAKPLLGSTL